MQVWGVAGVQGHWRKEDKPVVGKEGGREPSQPERPNGGERKRPRGTKESASDHNNEDSVSL